MAMNFSTSYKLTYKVIVIILTVSLRYVCSLFLIFDEAISDMHS